MKQQYTDLAGMAAWARRTMQSRFADVTIGPSSNPYLRRWWLVPRNEFANVYLHEILRSDDDRAMHDHPWGNMSFILEGGYREHTPDGVFIRRAGYVGYREATDRHRLEVLPGERALTLFYTGPKVRDWGFWCPQGFVPWQDFTAGENGELIGRGCGES